MSQTDIAIRWSFLEEESDAASVVSRRMEVLYLNRVARSLVPQGWYGNRCWNVFPVGEESCPSRCPAVKAVSSAEDILYCEERIYPGGGAQVELGVAVIPLGEAREHGEKAILLLRPKGDVSSEEAFRKELMESARKLLALSLRRLAGSGGVG